MIARPLAVAVALILPGAASVQAAEGAWAEGARASVRLIAAGVRPDGTLAAGIEIVLPPGWHTYWRTPGDAGIAPVFDFSGSANIGRVDVAFPLPLRRDDGFNVTNIYEERVVLPLRAAVTDMAAPVDLALTMDLGVCAEICVPDTVSVSLSVPPGEADEAAAASLAEAEARLPGAPQADFAVASIVRNGGTDKRPVFVVRARVPDPASAEVFIEGPGNWSAYRPVRGEDGGPAEVMWTVKFSRLGAQGPVDGVPFRVTIASGGRAIEQTMTPQ